MKGAKGQIRNWARDRRREGKDSAGCALSDIYDNTNPPCVIVATEEILFRRAHIQKESRIRRLTLHSHKGVVQGGQNTRFCSYYRLRLVLFPSSEMLMYAGHWAERSLQPNFAYDSRQHKKNFCSLIWILLRHVGDAVVFFLGSPRQLASIVFQSFFIRQSP